MSPELLTRIGDYELKEKLGQGGYGAVYKARDPLGRDVAIKILTGFGDSATTLNAFKKEAATLAKLQHPNIVTVYQFGVHNDQPYLAMEFLDGQPLSAIIKTRRELHLVEKLDIIIQGTEGLKHAHENNVIHRDIKPHNLMVVESPEKGFVVKLIDFGIAQGEASRSQSQSIAGSLPYMSPEHFVQKRTPWCDVFSMGVVTYELLTGGVVPYASDRDDLPVAYGKLMSQDPALPLSQHIPDLPPGLEEVIAKAINKNKLNGYESAEEFLFELSRVQETVKEKYVTNLLAEVEAAIQREDPTSAYDLVERVLRADPKNPAANRRKFELRKQVQESRRNQQVREICIRVESEIQERKFDAAQKDLEEAKHLDPGSPTVQQLQQKLQDIRRIQSRIEELVRVAQQHGASGNWEQASEAVKEASELDRSNTNVIKFQAEIERRVAQEHDLVEKARSLLHEKRFQEASRAIRELEAIAPKSERVHALKELAVREHREHARRTDIAAYLEAAHGLVAAGDLPSARAKLDEAIAKYSEERSLIELRATVEKQQEEIARKQFVEEKIKAAEQAIRARHYVDVIASLEQARLRVPDPKFEKLLATAKEKIQQQAAEKRRESCLKSARDSMTRGDAASAVVTLEMAQSEFGAGDDEIQTLLEEAHSAAEREAKAAAEREEAARKQAERKAKEAAEKREIATVIADVTATAQHGDYTAALKLIEQCASKFGMRAELAQAANQVKSQRTSEASTQVENFIEQARIESEAGKFSEALQVLDKAKAFTEFASTDVITRLKASEQRIRKAQQEHLASVTQIFKEAGGAQTPASSTAPTAVVTPERSPAQGGAAAAAAPARVPAARPGAAARRVAAEPAPLPPSPSKKLVPIIIAAVVVLIVGGIIAYFAMPSGIKVQFDAEPAGTLVNVEGQTCTTPCALSLKSGRHSLKATHDQYTELSKEIDVEKPYTETLRLTGVSAGSGLPELGTLSLTINVPGADISVDGQLKDTAKGTRDAIKVAAGHHEIKVEASGYTPATQPVDIVKDTETSLSFNLTPGGGGEVKTYLMINSEAGAKVVIDGQPAGTVQPDGKFAAQVDPGKRHSVDVSLDGFESYSRSFTPKPGEKLQVRAALKGLKPMIVAFSADNTDIRQGQSATLRWDTKGATDASIDPIGAVAAIGSRQVSPNATTTYTLIANGPGGKSAPQRVIIKVSAATAAGTNTATNNPTPAPKPANILMFNAFPAKVTQGQSANIVWQTQDADSVTIEPGIGSVGANGSKAVTPESDTKYTITARSAAGTKTQEVTITVEAKQQAQQSAQPQQTPASGPDDNAAIKTLLEQRWTSAFEADDVGELKALFPSIPKGTLDLIKGAKGIRLSLSCTPQVSGDKATASCRETATLGGKANNTSVNFGLSKSGGNWVITSSR